MVREKDRIDIVVNNAGYDLAGAIEEISMDDMRAQFETNFWSCKGDESCNTHNEKPKERQNSKYNIYGRNDCDSMSLHLPRN